VATAAVRDSWMVLIANRIVGEIPIMATPSILEFLAS
jgi:hypothetical protein